MHDAQIIEAEFTFTGQRFEPKTQVMVKPDGYIHHVGMLDAQPTHKLKNCALLPGMINVHSHAFQRGLRGCGETFPEKSGSFWTWREAMYGLVEKMDTDTMYTLSKQAFTEMIQCGITAVGEFHYLHHSSKRDYAFDDVILRAAKGAGIRMVLLNAYYNSGGINLPLNEAQQRFGSDSVKQYWQQMDQLVEMLDPATQSLGVVAHSIRATPLNDLVSLHEESVKRGLVFHMHVEEQLKEIEECNQAYGHSPMALLNDQLNIDNNFTAVHCTHTNHEDMKRFAVAGGNVCICPLTEANLGDGIADVPGIIEAGGHVCVGTDSNSRLCMTEELRWLEYAQRLSGQSRGVYRDANGSVSMSLWNSATINGAQSLGIHAGTIEVGQLADFIAIDLNSPTLIGWTPESLLDSFIFGTGNEAIVGVCVGGRWLKTPNAPSSS